MPAVEQPVPVERQSSFRSDLLGRVRRLVFVDYFVLVLCVVYFLAMLPFCPALGTLTIFKNIVGDMIPLLVVAIGQTFVLILGEIDLSVTSIIAFASVLSASLMSSDHGFLSGQIWAVPGGIVTFVLVGCVLGALNGMSVTGLGMPSFLVTLASRMFLSGAAIWYTTFHTKTTSISGLPGAFVQIGQGEWQGIPYSLPGVFVLALAAHIVLTRTVFGRWLFAIGINRRTARVSGVPVSLVVTGAFVISGLCAALSSLLYTARLQTGTPILGERILLDVIGAVVIGGTSLFGGKGRILWTVFGVLFLVLVDTTLRLLGSSLFTIFMIKGAVILLAATIDALRNRLFGER